MSMKHRIIINVANAQGTGTEVLRGKFATIRERVLRWLLGPARQVFLVDPGKTVDSVTIKEIEDVRESRTEAGRA